MVRRYPCQIAIVFVLGIWLAKAACQKEYLLAAAIFAAGLCIFSIWVHRELAMWPKLRQLAMLLLAFVLGFARMYLADFELVKSLDGLEDGAAASVQGRIVKKQFKVTGQNAQWVVDLADGYLKLEHKNLKKRSVKKSNAVELNTEKLHKNSRIIYNQKLFYNQNFVSSRMYQSNQNSISSQTNQLNQNFVSSQTNQLNQSFASNPIYQPNQSFILNPKYQSNQNSVSSQTYQLNQRFVSNPTYRSNQSFISNPIYQSNQNSVSSQSYQSIQEFVSETKYPLNLNFDLNPSDQVYPDTGFSLDLDSLSLHSKKDESQRLGMGNLHLLNSFGNADEIRPVGKIIVYMGIKEPVIGNTVVVPGKIKQFSSARNEGNFDESAYYQNQGYTFKFYAQDGYQVKNAEKNGFLEACYQMQQKLFTVYTNVMPENEAGVLSAMLLGEKSMLSEETKKLYQQSGIAHILAISGLHISILGAAIYRLFRKLGASYLISSVASMALLLAFGCMTGMGTSTMRAVVMFGIYLGAACCGRAYDSMNGLAVAAVCLLLQNPGAMFLAGFQFSFAAILGVLFGKEICRIFQPRLRVAETVFISLGIQIVTLPLTAWYYFEIPIYSILLNMIVLPFMEIALLAGLLGGGFGLLAGWFGGGARLLTGLPVDVLLGFCTILLNYFSKAGSLFLELPGALYAVGKPHIWQMAGYYSVLVTCIFLIFHAKQRQDKETGKQKKEQFLCRQKIVLRTGSLICFVLLFLRLPGQAEVDILDVGQGDGIYIHTGDGQDVLIDGGSTDVSKVGAYRILPFLKSKGVRRLDYWFVSHLDKDHISGLEELVDSGFPIGQVVLAEGVLEDEAYEKFTGKLAQSKVQMSRLAKGDALRGEKSRFLCLAPGKTGLEDDRNARSMVLLYEDSGFSAFFSGDISREEERKLVEEGRVIHTIFYKAAHHGSNTSNSVELLSKLEPLISVVSCAENNDYGHPGKEAVENMDKASQSVYYTMKGGRIQIRWGKGKVRVQEFVMKSFGIVTDFMFKYNKF